MTISDFYIEPELTGKKEDKLKEVNAEGEEDKLAEFGPGAMVLTPIFHPYLY